MRGYTVDCPRYKELREEGKKDADYLEVMAQNKVADPGLHQACVLLYVFLQDLFARVKKNTGIDYDLNPDNAYQISDPLFCEVCLTFYLINYWLSFLL